jgi:hypothetical protein
VFFPPPALCTDNGVMAAWAGIEKLRLGISDSISEVDVDAVPRWPLGVPLTDDEKVRMFSKLDLKRDKYRSHRHRSLK